MQTAMTAIARNKQSERSYSLPYVLTHEIGHVLGLDHSSLTEAVMHNSYKNLQFAYIQLDMNDKYDINWNYSI